MANDFSFASAPFSALTAPQQTQLRELLQLVAHPAGTLLLRPQDVPEHLSVIRSGHVQIEEGEHIHVLGPGEPLGWRALLTGRNHATATALDALELWLLPRATLLELLGDNQPFSAKVFAQVSHHLADDADIDHNREMMSLMLVRVKDAYLQKPVYVDGKMDLVSVCRILSQHKIDNALVRDGHGDQLRIGIFTTTDLRDAVINTIAPHQVAVRDVAHFDLISLPPEAELFEALLTMLRHRVHRVLVQDDEQVLGILSQLDLMSYMSNHSHLITLQVEQAHNLEQLRQAALQVDDSVKMLQRGGMRIEIIAKLCSELNGQIFSRLWSLLAPPELLQNSCLLVMGSEGRGEQILKTDQDNALLLRDGFEHPGLTDMAQAFSAALLSFGYPPCPGNIMVTNPMWCQCLASFKETIGQWLFGADPEGGMNLAIFLDARVVAGDASLLAQAREHALTMAIGSNTFVGRMASAIDQFSEPASGWWSRLMQLQLREAQTFDLKKIGTFPIVHGARVLALEHRLSALSTVERLQSMANQAILPAALVRDLMDTLHMLMAFKLRNNLRQIALGQPISNLVELRSVGTLDRDMLKECLNIIRSFKQHLRLRYHLED